ncbi:MAG TPA: glycoside hydrolase family 3 N-terminal domain-containing protein, partial [Aggregatilineales bacterium]|nr:glycoside hydrolase family 3 N-terminal domain-containing protein [Aggregatilineales bacterium]
MRKICIILTLLTVTMWIPGASAQNAENSPSDADIQRVENLLATMTVEQKVGQMFMVSLFGHGMTEQGEDLLRTYQPGAVAIFGFNTDFEPAPQVARLLNEMQAIAVESGAGIPLIIAADQEGGDVRRIVNDVTKFPDPMGFGAITNLVSIEHIGQATGAELRAIGVNMNLAPIADLYTPEDITDENRVLHRRTFGDDPERVGVQVAAYSDGLAEAGVIGVLKHFPGHGGAEDSHQTLPQIDMDYETAMSTALRSFQVAIEQNVPAIMVGHLYYGAIEPVPNLPASLSPTMNHILREDFGFDGVIMTDALDMSAVSETYTVPQAALMAIQAG